jgi:hypothetical protein
VPQLLLLLLLVAWCVEAGVVRRRARVAAAPEQLRVLLQG